MHLSKDTTYYLLKPGLTKRETWETNATRNTSIISEMFGVCENYVRHCPLDIQNISEVGSSPSLVLTCHYTDDTFFSVMTVISCGCNQKHTWVLSTNKSSMVTARPVNWLY